MSPDNSSPAAGKKKALIIAFIAVVLAIDYATILRIEIFDEMRSGRSALDAVMHGNLALTLLGIAISVIGVAWLLTLVFSRNQ